MAWIPGSFLACQRVLVRPLHSTGTRTSCRSLVVSPKLAAPNSDSFLFAPRITRQGWSRVISLQVACTNRGTLTIWEWQAPGGDREYPAITHAYLHNTVFRGWALDYWRRYPDEPGSLLAQYMGKKAHYIERYGHYSPSIRSGVIALLSATGRDALRNQLRSLAETFEPVIFCGFDLSFERFVLRNISRQIHYGIFLGWIEEIDVESPVFHQAPWRWYPSTHPADRYHDRAIQSLYQTIGRGLADIPDFGTGKPVRVLPTPGPQNWRNAVWFPAARAARRRVRRLLYGPSQPPPLPRGPDFDSALRQRRVLEALQEGLAAVSENTLFNRDAVASALGAYLTGGGPGHDVLWAVAVAGQMGRLVADSAKGHRGVRMLPAPAAVIMTPDHGHSPGTTALTSDRS